MDAPRLKVAVPSDTSHADLCYYGVGLDGPAWPVWASVNQRPFVRVRAGGGSRLAFEGRSPAVRVVWLDPSGRLAEGEVAPTPMFQKLQATTINANTNIATSDYGLITDVKGAHVTLNMGESSESSESVHKTQEFDLAGVHPTWLTRSSTDSQSVFEGPPQLRVCVATDNELTVGRIHRQQMQDPTGGADWPLGFGPGELSLSQTRRPDGKLSEEAWRATRQWMKRQVSVLRYDPRTDAIAHEPRPDPEPGAQAVFRPSGATSSLTVSFGAVSESVEVRPVRATVHTAGGDIPLTWFWSRQVASIGHDVHRYLVWLPLAPAVLRIGQAEGRCDENVWWRLLNGTVTVLDHRAAPAEVRSDLHQAGAP